MSPISSTIVEIVLLSENFAKLSGSVPPYEYYRNHNGNIVQVKEGKISTEMAIEIAQQAGMTWNDFLTKINIINKVIEQHLLDKKNNHK